MNNNCQRKFIDNNDFIPTFPQDYGLKYSNINQQEILDQQIIQKREPFIDFAQPGYNYDKIDFTHNVNNRAISPNQSKVIQMACNSYQSKSPYKNQAGQQITPNGKQNSYKQHQNSFVGVDQNQNQLVNDNNISATTLNTTNASFSQYLNQTANTNKYFAIDMSNSSQQNPLSSRQYRQTNSFHCIQQMGNQQNSFQISSKAEVGEFSTFKGTPASQKNKQCNQMSFYNPSERSYHSVYSSPIHNTVLNSYINDSEVNESSLSSRQNLSSYSRAKSTHVNSGFNGTNQQNNFSDNHLKLTDYEINHQKSIDGIGSQQNLISARGHHKNNSCYTPSRLTPDQQNNNSQFLFSSNHDSYLNSTTKQINQIENIFSNMKNYSQISTPFDNNKQSAQQKSLYKQNTNGIQTLNYTPNKQGMHTLNNIFNTQIQQYNLNNTSINKLNQNNNSSINTPRNNKEQKICNQVFDTINNQKQSSQFNHIEQSIPSYGHTKNHSLQQQRTGQSFNTSLNSINQSNFLQNSSFINHSEKQQQQLDSKSTFNPSSNFETIAQNKSGFINSSSSILNSNGDFLISSKNRNNYSQGINSGKGNNFKTAINGLLGQQSLLNKGPQLQKIIDDLKENIVKDLESLTSKLYKESESIINSTGNSIDSNSFESISSNPIQLAEFDIGDDRKVRFSFSGKDVITQITSTNMKLNREQNKCKENIIQTFFTPLNSSQFLSPYQQQLLTDQIMNCSNRNQLMQYTLKKSNIHEQSQESYNTLSSPQSIDLTSSTHSNDQNNRIHSFLPNSFSGNKPSPIFNNSTRFYEMQKDNNDNKSNYNNKSFNLLYQGERKEEKNKLKNEQNVIMNKHIQDFVGFTYSLKSDEEHKIFGQFFKNNDSLDQKQSHLQSSEIIGDQKQIHKVEDKENNPSLNQNQILKQDYLQTYQYIPQNNLYIQEQGYESKNINQQKIISPPQNKEKQQRNLNQNQQEKQNDNDTPQKKELKNINTEESENIHGKLTPCFQSSKSKNTNKNTINTNNKSEKTQSDELNDSQQITGLKPFCINFDNKQVTESINNLECQNKNDLSKTSISSFEITHQNDLIKSNSVQENAEYEEEFQNITQIVQSQNKNDNLSDQDDVILRTDNTDQFSEDSHQTYTDSSNQQQNIIQIHQLNQQNKQEYYKESSLIPEFSEQIQKVNDHFKKDIENLNSHIQTSYNFQKQQKQTSYQSKDCVPVELQTDQNQVQYSEHLTSTSSSQLHLKEKSDKKKNQLSNENKISSFFNNSSNSGCLKKNSEPSQQNDNSSSNTLSQGDQSLTQDRCSYRGSAKSSQSNSSAQNRYQDLDKSSHQQSLIENNVNSESGSLISLNIYNNSDTFTCQNIQSLRYKQNIQYNQTSNKDVTKVSQGSLNSQSDKQLNNQSISSKNSYFDQKNPINLHLNENNTLNDNQNLNVKKSLNQNNPSIEKQKESNQLNRNNTSSGSNLLNGNNIRFSTYLKQHGEQKNQLLDNYGLVFDNKNFSSNNESLNSSFISSSSSQPYFSKYSISPANVSAQKQILFKNKSNLKFFKDYEMKMKIQQEQGQINLNECYNSLTDMKERFFNIRDNKVNQTINNDSKPISLPKLNIKDLKMNKLQLDKLKENDKYLKVDDDKYLKVDDDEVHTSRENPLDQIRENTNSTQGNEEDLQCLTFQNQPLALTSNSKRNQLLDDKKTQKSVLQTDFKFKRDPTRPFTKEAESNISSRFSNGLFGGLYNSSQEKKDSSFFYTPLNIADLTANTQNDGSKLISNIIRTSQKDEQSPASSFKDSSQPTQSPYYASSRSNFYESTQKLIEDSVTLSNMKNDLSYGNMSKYSNSSSQSKYNNNVSGLSNQDDSKRSETSRILRHNMDDDDNDGLLNIEDNFDNNILNDVLQNVKLNVVNQTPVKHIQQTLKNTPEKVQRKPLEVLKQATPQLNKDKDSINTSHKKESKDTLTETQILNNQNKKSQNEIKHSPKQQDKKEQRSILMDDIFNKQDQSQSLSSSHSSDFSKLSQQIIFQKQKSNSSQSLSEHQQQQSLVDLKSSIESINTDEDDFSKNTNIERDVCQQKQLQNTLKDFEFSSNSSPQSLADIPESSTVPSFSKLQNHQSICQIISSSIQVKEEDGTEITISIVSHKRSSVNQSKTILKKSLIQSPTSQALAKASSVQKSQRRISFKDKIEEVYNFEPEDRTKSRSPFSKGLPRSKPRFDLRKEPYFNSIKKFPGIQNNPTLLQQYKNKGSSNISFNLEDKINEDDKNNSSSIIETNQNQEDSNNVSILSRRDSKLNNMDDISSTKPQFKPLSFTPNSSSNKKVGKISFLEYQKINKN